MMCACAANGNFCDLEAALSVQSDVHDAINNVFTHPEGTFPPVSSHAPVTFPPVSHPDVTFPPVSHPDFTFPPVSHPDFTFPPVSHPDVTFPPVSHSDGCHENKQCFWDCLKHRTPTPTPTTTAGALPLSLLSVMPQLFIFIPTASPFPSSLACNRRRIAAQDHGGRQALSLLPFHVLWHMLACSVFTAMSAPFIAKAGSSAPHCPNSIKPCDFQPLCAACGRGTDPSSQ